MSALCWGGEITPTRTRLPSFLRAPSLPCRRHTYKPSGLGALLTTLVAPWERRVRFLQTPPSAIGRLGMRLRWEARLPGSRHGAFRGVPRRRAVLPELTYAHVVLAGR